MTLLDHVPFAKLLGIEIESVEAGDHGFCGIV